MVDARVVVISARRGERPEGVEVRGPRVVVADGERQRVGVDGPAQALVGARERVAEEKQPFARWLMRYRPSCKSSLVAGIFLGEQLGG
jgi:hypothetical protein